MFASCCHSISSPVLSELTSNVVLVEMTVENPLGPQFHGRKLAEDLFASLRPCEHFGLCTYSWGMEKNCLSKLLMAFAKALRGLAHLWMWGNVSKHHKLSHAKASVDESSEKLFIAKLCMQMQKTRWSLKNSVKHRCWRLVMHINLPRTATS